MGEKRQLRLKKELQKMMEKGKTEELVEKTGLSAKQLESFANSDMSWHESKVIRVMSALCMRRKVYYEVFNKETKTVSTSSDPRHFKNLPFGYTQILKNFEKNAVVNNYVFRKVFK